MRTTVTSAELLRGLADSANRTAWQDYVDRYRPVLLQYAARLGISAADAEDVAQQTLVAFLEGYRAGRYDPHKGRLRHWLFGIATNTARAWRRGRARLPLQPADTGTSFLDGVADDRELEALWDVEWRASLVEHCLALVRDEVQDKTWQAFDRFACRDEPAAAVARDLGMTENAVYGAKRRVLDRVRELAQELGESW
jgi:RNA polymerase sigma-70 factor (ECF subfamily)